VLGLKPRNQDNFVLAGGNSLKALEFMELLEDKLKSLLPSQTLDKLLHESFDTLVNFLQNHLNFKHPESNIDSSVLTKTPRIVFEEKSDDFINHKVIGWASKLSINLFDRLLNNQIHIESSSMNMKMNWKYDTSKCIDATPLLIVYENDLKLVIVGSHSNQLVCIDGSNGKSNWIYRARDRIESSACVSKCRRYVIFGK
jgi:hypothetical protein